MHTIGDFSRLTRIPVKTLRYYDAIGLLRPARVERATGYRYYTAAQYELLNRILVLKDLGCSLREIQSLVTEHASMPRIRAMLRRKHDELARHVGRETARLARAAARLDLLEQSDQPAAHNVAVRDAGTWLVASVRGVVTAHDECDRLFEELDRETGGHRDRRQRGVVWHACAEGAIDCEAFVFLPSRIDARGRVRISQIPAHRVASLVYRGDGDYLSAYRAMRTWLAISGVAITGPKREIFLADGRHDSEPVTEIQFPIATPGQAQ